MTDPKWSDVGRQARRTQRQLDLSEWWTKIRAIKLEDWIMDDDQSDFKGFFRMLFVGIAGLAVIAVLLFFIIVAAIFLPIWIDIPIAAYAIYRFVKWVVT